MAGYFPDSPPMYFSVYFHNRVFISQLVGRLLFFFNMHLHFTFPRLSYCCHYSRFHQIFVGGVGLNALIIFRFAPYFSTAVAKHSYSSGVSLRTARW